MSKNDAIIGVSDHGGWAVLVTVAADGILLDRRRVELGDQGLPKIPHHSAEQVFGAMSDAVGVADLGAHFLQERRSIGPPWGYGSQLEMAAATVATILVTPHRL